MSNIASVSLILAYFLLVWLRTNAFVEYMTLLKLGRFFRIDEYNDIQKNGYGGLYMEFLYSYYHDRFLVRLFSCPVCLSFWAGISLVVFLGTIDAMVGAPLILFFYLLLNKML